MAYADIYNAAIDTIKGAFLLIRSSAGGATQALADALSAGRTEVRSRNCAAAEY